ncbi:ATP phosphoribosyltransferase regulatory subunit [Breoghania sp. L-A4]|uniref:ATP phosphoribosyltransferase regulatory subunit n=1 Tax=Breoghania sp. L-A4 TaxID=2304600 RepID=UPI000E35DE97|nr:ATP phosphoribosyltransferase regulatory subunit [Breoghania sp. L-A4]AXS42440.1 ATP phosphoribosyltransferase regulatory subunit [Breoghania sp. L-A4]
MADERFETLAPLFAERGHAVIAPPILQPADIFLDLVGEDIRRRLFLTSGQDGVDLCLRPDFTIPVARAHLDSGEADRRAAYCYSGLVFRQRSGELGEIAQAGAECIGRADRFAADADMLALAVDAVKALGCARPAIRIGDEALFTALLEALGLPQVWRRRLRDLFGERSRLDHAIARMAGGGAPRDERLGFLAALEGSNPDAAHAIVEDLLSIAGISTVGGRTAGEIADRFLEQAALSSGAGAGPQVAAALSRFLDISGAPEQAADALDAFARDEKLDLAAPIADFRQRTALIAARGIDVGAVTFAADFGRRLDYYTGFVFELHGEPGEPQPLAGGGRYDRLLALLGAGQDVPAVGFSIWLDRITSGAGA